MSESPIYRGCLVGCGNQGRAHYNDYYVGSTRARLIAATDIDEQKTGFFKEKGISAYGSIAQMLSAESPELVNVVVPPALHTAVIRDVLNAGTATKGIFLEKPMTTHLGEADEILTECEKRNIKLVIGHQLRYDPDWSAPRGLIDANAIGAVRHIWAIRHSPLLTHHTHQTDLMRYYLADSPAMWVIGQVHRTGSYVVEGLELEMQALALVQFECGAMGLIQSGGVKVAGDNQIFIAGETGDIRFQDSKTQFRNESTNGQWQTAAGGVHANILDDWVRWIEGGPTHPCHGRSGKETLELLMAIYESSRRRGRVDLPLDRRGNAFDEMRDGGELP